MNTHVDEGIGTLIGQQIAKAVDERGMTIMDLADKIGGTYENTRKLVRGLSTPSAYLLRVICTELELDFTEMQKLSTADKIRKKYGTIPIELAGKKPSLEPVERVWDLLNKQQQQAVVTMVNGWAKQNRTVGA